MRGEELCGGRDLVSPSLLLLLEPGEDLIFTFGDIELVEPADDFDVSADLLSQHVHGAAQDRVFGENVRGDQQFSEVPFTLEHERHRPVPVAAVVRKQQ